MRKFTRLRLNLLPVFFLGALFAGGCSSSDTDAAATTERQTNGTPATLGGTDWTLIKLEGAAVEPAGAVTLTFDNANGAAGRAAANRYMVVSVHSGSGDSLRLGRVSSTRMLGSEAQMALERRYLGVLEAVTRWRISDGRLYLGTAANPHALVYSGGGK